MGRAEPCVLFAQTFVHPHLDEYVDEVLFAEPVVVTACEFLEQNALSTSQAVTLAGATLPPSFALEVFVQCEGETRFRRLCQPFLYSHSSSNVLEVEAVVTNHLVVRGSYRSLSLVIYGNTAEDLGQFNIGLDDSSITNLVSSDDGKLEDLPPPLLLSNMMIEKPICALTTLSLPVVASDISIELKQFLQMMVKILEILNIRDGLHEVIRIVASVASSHVSNAWGMPKDANDLCGVISVASKELLRQYEVFLNDSSNAFSHLSPERTSLELDIEVATSKHLVDILSKYFHFNMNLESDEHPMVPKTTSVILGLSLALLLCSGRESCFHFVNIGGMELVGHIFGSDMQNSSTISLLLLGVIEQATRHSVGCEGFLGWWPREDENVPSGISEGYSQLLNLLLHKPRHDIASLTTFVLHRLRLYEVASRYESAVLSILGGLATSGKLTSGTWDTLISTRSQLKKLLKLINSYGPIDDPSPAEVAARSLVLCQSDGPFSFKATNFLISLSKCCFSNWDIDSRLLVLLKERGFLPLSAALLSSTILQSEVGHAMDIFVDIASSIEAIILSLLFTRSGLIFLLEHPELADTIIYALRGVEDVNREQCIPLRYASILIAKGFFCGPSEVATIVWMHLRVVNAIDCLLTSTPHSEEFLWVLWELCGLSRSDCGRQALLVLGYFPEAISILIETLHFIKEPEPVSKTSGASPPNLAIFHSVAEIFEVIVTDSAASSLGSWIGHAVELQKALHSSSLGSNKKDAPTRMLEWIDAGVFYHKNGAIGVLKYAAVVVSGGDAHLTTSNMVVSDLTDVENIVGDSTVSDVNVIENLGKLIAEKTFDGVALRDSSIVQLTTAFRILAHISENLTVATALYDEGAISVIFTVLVNCAFMLERSSNSYDYLVDEGTECNSTQDLLLERNREQNIIDLLIPSLVLLVNLLRALQDAKEQHRNTKLMNSLLRLHREVSPKLAAHASDLSSPYPLSALGFGAICQLIASALACWPIYGWIPGLFSSLLVNVQATSLLTLGPKETCSLLCLLNDLFPNEGVWLWKNGMPLFSALKKLSIGTLLGPQKERQLNWYLEPGHHEKLTNQLTPQLHKISHVIQQYAISTLVVIQDMLRVFVICMSCEKSEIASALVRPILSWTSDYVSECSSFTETDAYKVFRYLDFLTSLLEHPRGKGLLLKEGVVQLLVKVLGSSFDDIDTDEKQFPDIRSSKCGFSLLNWCLPVFKSISLLSNSRTSLQPSGRHDLHYLGCLNTEDCTLIWPYVLEFGQVLPVGKELLACLTAFRDLVSFDGGQRSLESILSDVTNHDKSESQKGNEKDGDLNFFNRSRWMDHPPLLSCLKKLLRSVESKGGITSYVIEAIDALSCGCSLFCMDGTNLISDRILKVKSLFGLSDDGGGENGLSEESISHTSEIVHLLDSFITACENLDMSTSLYPAIESVKSLSTLLQHPSRVEDDKIFGMDVPSVPNDIVDSSKIHHMVDASAAKVDDFLCAGGLGDKFLWECPEILPDRLTTLPTKRKMPLEGGPIRRARGDNLPAETTSQNTFSRGSGSSAIPTGPTRRDTFRQRKPNTSRPPSMHVDDYVARERSVDNVIAVQRIGSSSGRPPSIHVDEFMARQRERQNPVAAAASEATLQGKPGAHANDSDQEKFKSKQMKADMDDDLHGIDIIFDGEESEPDDKLPFPQLDDSLQQHAPAMVEQGSPHSIVEETESDANESSQFSHLGTPLASNIDENAQSEFSSRMSVSRPEMPLAREPSVTSEKKYLDQSDDPKNVTPFRSSNGSDSPLTVHSKFPTSVYNNTVTASPKLGGDSRATPPKFFPKNNLQRLGSGPGPGFQGHYDQRALPNQPPLPPMPPPPSIAPVISQASDLIPSQSIPFVNVMNEGQQQFPTSFQAQSDYASAYNNSTSFPPLPVSDSKYSKTPISSSGGPVRQPPPLPPTPPPFLSPQYNLAAVKPSLTQSSGYHQGGVGTADFSQTSIVPSADGHLGGGSTSGAGARQMAYPLPPLVPQLIISRPSSMPANLYGSISSHSNESPPNILQNLSIPQSSLQSIHSYAQLQPLQPPQLPRPPQPPQHLRPPIQASQQLEQGVSMQSPAQIQIPQMQMIQQPHVSPIHYYQAQPLELSNAKQPQSDHVLPQVLQQPGNGTSQQQQDLGMSLHEYFKSPEAIQSLLSDREKLCQLLEQHPKLMQMLQERLGQL